MKRRASRAIDPRDVGISTGVVFVLLTSLGSALLYVYSKAVYEADVRDRLQRLTTAVATLVDPELHERITSPQQDESPEYAKAVAPLRGFLRAMPDLRVVYTLRLVDDKPRYVLDARPPGDADRDGVPDHVAPMTACDEVPAAALRALREGKRTTADFSQGRQALLVSGFAPIRDAHGRTVGVVGIDMTLKAYQSAMSGLKEITAFSLLVGLALSAGAAFAVYKLLGRRLDAERESAQSREAREAAEERYRIVSETASDAILVVDDKGCISYANPAVESVFGHKPAEMQGQYSSVLLPDLLRGAAPRSFGSEDDASAPLELAVRSKDGTEKFVEVTMTETKEGDRTFLVSSYRDISHRKILEQKTQEAIDAKMEFLSIVTHELRTPLTVIKESVEIIEDGSSGPVNAEQKSFLGIAKRNVHRLRRLVDNVLDYQKLEARRMDIVKEPTDLDDVIVEVCESYALVASEKGLEVKAERCGGLPKIELDRDRVVQVLGNFVDNAIKYTPKGRVVVSVELCGERVKVSVADQGLGMPEEELGNLFGVFNQLSNARAQKVKGTGLGLSICKKIIELHGGEVGVVSVLGRGSKFFFLLPVHPMGGSHVEEGADRGRRAGRGDGAREAVSVAGLRDVLR